MRALLGLVLIVALLALPPAGAEGEDACGPTGQCAVDGPACDALGADRCYLVQRIVDELLP